MKTVQRIFIPFPQPGENSKEFVLDIPKDADVVALKQEARMVEFGKAMCSLSVLVFGDFCALNIPRRFLLALDGVTVPDSAILLDSVLFIDGRVYILYEITEGIVSGESM